MSAPVGDGSDDSERDHPAPEPTPETEAVRVRVQTAVRAVRRGDRQAYGRLVELYQRRIFGLTLMMLRNPAEAEEITQDAFIRALDRLELYDDRRPFYPWLATIAVRLAQTRLRSRARLATREGTPLDPERDAAPTADPLQEFIADESGRRLWRAVSALPSGQRTAVVLYYREQMKVREIAGAIGVTSGTVKTLLFRARKKLRLTLDPSGSVRQPKVQT